MFSSKSSTGGYSYGTGLYYTNQGAYWESYYANGGTFGGKNVYHASRGPNDPHTGMSLANLGGYLNNFASTGDIGSISGGLFTYRTMSRDAGSQITSDGSSIGAGFILNDHTLHLAGGDNGGGIPVGIPTFPWEINLGLNYDRYHTNVSYSENVWRLDLPFGMKFLHVNIPSINIGFSAFDLNSKDIKTAQQSLASIINIVRSDLLKAFNDNSVNTNKQATDFFLNDLQTHLRNWFSVSGADLRPATSWNDQYKTSLHYWLP